MPNRWAVASGNWSNPATWNGGTLPASGDDVFPNTFTVSVDQNITALSLRSNSSTGINAGGTFSFNTPNITANVTGQIIAGAASLINVTATTGSVTINAPAANITFPTTGFTGAIISITGNCNFNITAISVSAATGTQNAQIISKTSGSGDLNIISNLIGGNGAGANVNQAVRVTSNCNVNITGNLTGGTGGPASQALAVTGGGNTIITGNLTGGSQNAFQNQGNTTIIGTITGGFVGGVNNLSGVLNHIGTAQASVFSSAIVGDVAGRTTILTGPFLRNGSVVAVSAQSFTINSAYNPYFEFRSSNGTNVVYVDQSTLNFPAIADVRSGTTYASGLYTGTLNVPLPSQVLAGIPIDATTGTLLMSPADFWNYLISNGFVSGSIGERLQNASTVATTGSQIASYTI